MRGLHCVFGLPFVLSFALIFVLRCHGAQTNDSLTGQ
jgi:hypothetical protein